MSVAKQPGQSTRQHTAAPGSSCSSPVQTLQRNSSTICGAGYPNVAAPAGSSSALVDQGAINTLLSATQLRSPSTVPASVSSEPIDVIDEGDDTETDDVAYMQRVQRSGIETVHNDALWSEYASTITASITHDAYPAANKAPSSSSSSNTSTAKTANETLSSSGIKNPDTSVIANQTPSSSAFMVPDASLLRDNIFLDAGHLRLGISIIDAHFESADGDIIPLESYTTQVRATPKYAIRVRVGMHMWIVNRSYSDFKLFHSHLKQALRSEDRCLLPHLPGKVVGIPRWKLFGSPDQLHARMNDLQAYLRMTVRIAECWDGEAGLHVIAFLDDARKTLALQTTFARIMRKTEKLMKSRRKEDLSPEELHAKLAELMAEERKEAQLKQRLQCVSTLMRDHLADSGFALADSAVLKDFESDGTPKQATSTPPPPSPAPSSSSAPAPPTNVQKSKLHAALSRQKVVKASPSTPEPAASPTPSEESETRLLQQQRPAKLPEEVVVDAHVKQQRQAFIAMLRASQQALHLATPPAAILRTPRPRARSAAGRHNNNNTNKQGNDRMSLSSSISDAVRKSMSLRKSSKSAAGMVEDIDLDEIVSVILEESLQSDKSDKSFSHSVLEAMFDRSSMVSDGAGPRSFLLQEKLAVRTSSMVLRSADGDKTTRKKRTRRCLSADDAGELQLLLAKTLASSTAANDVMPLTSESKPIDVETLCEKLRVGFFAPANAHREELKVDSSAAVNAAVARIIHSSNTPAISSLQNVIEGIARHVGPCMASEMRRHEIANAIVSILRCGSGLEAFPVGSFATSTYLPDFPIDVFIPLPPLLVQGPAAVSQTRYSAPDNTPASAWYTKVNEALCSFAALGPDAWEHNTSIEAVRQSETLFSQAFNALLPPSLRTNVPRVFGKGFTGAQSPRSDSLTTTSNTPQMYVSVLEKAASLFNNMEHSDILLRLEAELSKATKYLSKVGDGIPEVLRDDEDVAIGAPVDISLLEDCLCLASTAKWLHDAANDTQLSYVHQLAAFAQGIKSKDPSRKAIATSAKIEQQVFGATPLEERLSVMTSNKCHRIANWAFGSDGRRMNLRSISFNVHTPPAESATVDAKTGPPSSSTIAHTLPARFSRSAVVTCVVNNIPVNILAGKQFAYSLPGTPIAPSTAPASVSGVSKTYDLLVDNITPTHDAVFTDFAFAVEIANAVHKIHKELTTAAKQPKPMHWQIRMLLPSRNPHDLQLPRSRNAALDAFRNALHLPASTDKSTDTSASTTDSLAKLPCVATAQLPCVATAQLPCVATASITNVTTGRVISVPIEVGKLGNILRESVVLIAAWLRKEYPRLLQQTCQDMKVSLERLLEVSNVLKAGGSDGLLSSTQLHVMVLALFSAASQCVVTGIRYEWEAFLPESGCFESSTAVLACFAAVYANLDFTAFIVSPLGILPKSAQTLNDLRDLRANVHATTIAEMMVHHQFHSGSKDCLTEETAPSTASQRGSAPLSAASLSAAQKAKRNASSLLKVEEGRIMEAIGGIQYPWSRDNSVTVSFESDGTAHDTKAVGGSFSELSAGILAAHAVEACRACGIGSLDASPAPATASIAYTDTALFISDIALPWLSSTPCSTGADVVKLRLACLVLRNQLASLMNSLTETAPATATGPQVAAFAAHVSACVGVRLFPACVATQQGAGGTRADLLMHPLQQHATTTTSAALSASPSPADDVFSALHLYAHTPKPGFIDGEAFKGLIKLAFQEKSPSIHADWSVQQQVFSLLHAPAIRIACDFNACFANYAFGDPTGLIAVISRLISCKGVVPMGVLGQMIKYVDGGHICSYKTLHFNVEDPSQVVMQSFGKIDAGADSFPALKLSAFGDVLSASCKLFFGSVKSLLQAFPSLFVMSADNQSNPCVTLAGLRDKNAFILVPSSIVDTAAVFLRGIYHIEESLHTAVYHDYSEVARMALQHADTDVMAHHETLDVRRHTNASFRSTHSSDQKMTASATDHKATTSMTVPALISATTEHFRARLMTLPLPVGLNVSELTAMEKLWLSMFRDGDNLLLPKPVGRLSMLPTFMAAFPLHCVRVLLRAAAMAFYHTTMPQIKKKSSHSSSRKGSNASTATKHSGVTSHHHTAATISSAASTNSDGRTSLHYSEDHNPGRVASFQHHVDARRRHPHAAYADTSRHQQQQQPSRGSISTQRSFGGRMSGTTETGITVSTATMPAPPMASSHAPTSSSSSSSGYSVVGYTTLSNGMMAAVSMAPDGSTILMPTSQYSQTFAPVMSPMVVAAPGYYPMMASPMMASPMMASPMMGSPMMVAPAQPGMMYVMAPTPQYPAHSHSDVTHTRG